MNHLSGLSLPTPPLEVLVRGDSEREELQKFRATFNEHVDANLAQQPTFEQDPDSLPASGWRPLDDVTLLRFLRADERSGKYRHEISSARLLNALAWRKQMRSDSLISNPPPDHERYSALRIRRWVGRDLTHRPVQFERLGRFMSSGNTSAFSNSEWLQHYARDLETTFEEMRSASVAANEPITTYLFCGDLEGVGGIWRHLGTVIPLLKLLTKEVEANFPEMVGNIVLFNAPRIFAGLYSMVKVFMDPITAAKVEVYSGVPTARFLALMGAKTVPKEYGGESTAAYPQTAIHGK